MNYLNEIVDSVNSILWGKNLLVFILIGAALYFSFKTRFMQFRLFSKIIKVLFKKDKDKGGVSSLETFFLGTACRVGAGNIAGVVAAIAVGGPGSIFWMWIVALFGASTAFVESSLAVIYRKKIAENQYVGGTPYIIQEKLKMRWLGITYALASVICYLGVIQIMSNSITDSITSVYSDNFNLEFLNLRVMISIVITIIVAYIIFNKTKKDSIILTLNKIVPFMAVIYVILVLYILVSNITSIPSMIGDIFFQAFGGKELFGGAFGTIVMFGVRRGLFSNEAGSGNSNYAAAAVETTIPAKQGMVQAFGVFIDTLVICSATAFVVLLAPKNITDGLSGMALFQSAISYHIGSTLGSPFVVIIMFFFCLSTILAVTFYGKSAMYFLSEHKNLNLLFQLIVVLMVYIGGVQQNLFVWSLADFGLGIMTVINIMCIIPISKPAIDSLKEYELELKK